MILSFGEVLQNYITWVDLKYAWRWPSLGSALQDVSQAGEAGIGTLLSCLKWGTC